MNILGNITSGGPYLKSSYGTTYTAVGFVYASVTISDSNFVLNSNITTQQITTQNIKNVPDPLNNPPLGILIHSDCSSVILPEEAYGIYNVYFSVAIGTVRSFNNNYVSINISQYKSGGSYGGNYTVTGQISNDQYLISSIDSQKMTLQVSSLFHYTESDKNNVFVFFIKNDGGNDIIFGDSTRGCITINKVA